MRNPTYLTVSRDGVFHFRWPLPKTLHPERKPSCIKISIRTRDPKRALRLSRQLSYVGQALTRRGIASGMRYDEIRETLRKHYAELLENKKQQIAEHGRLDVEAVESLENGAGLAQAAIDWSDNIVPGQDDANLVKRFADRYGFDLEPGTKAYASFRDEMQKAYRDYCAAVLDYDRSLDRFDYADRTDDVAKGQLSRAGASSATLADITDKFIAEQLRAGNWGGRTEDQKRQYLHLLQEILSADRDAEKITALDAQNVKEVLLKYPKNRNKNPATKDLPINRLMELTGVDALTIRTVNSYLQTYASMFAWAKRNQYIAGNPFEGVSVREKKGNEKGRSAFSPSEVELMLKEIETNAMGLIRKDFQKWGPLIGLYTGARLNEISQVQLADIRQAQSIWCFDFNDEGDGKRLKNQASKRLVPIHSRLLEAGLLEHIAVLKQKGNTRLFPGFSYSPKEGYGRSLGRWFNDRFLVSLGIKRDSLVFHSLRHTMVTRLMQAGVDENKVKAIVGHTRQGVTQQHYFGQGYTLAQLREVLAVYEPDKDG